MSDAVNPENTVSPNAATSPLEAVEAIYAAMQDKLNIMLAACETKAERDDVLQKFVAARHNFDDCLNQQFHANDPALTTLVDQANGSAAEIEAIDAQLGQIAKVIGILTTAVTYGAKIVAKVVPV